MSDPVCPSCRRAAPVVLRGIQGYCTACGAPRTPLQSVPVNVAGKPSQVGGTIASVMGWVVLGLGLAGAALFGALFQWIFAGGVVGYVVFAIFALISSIAGGALLFGGRKLTKSGNESAHDAQERALFALAETRGGRLEAAEVASALAMTTREADDLMTGLARSADGRVSLEFDDDGRIFYLFPAFAPTRFAAPVRIDPAVVNAAKRDFARVAPVGEPAETDDAAAAAPPRKMQR